MDPKANRPITERTLHENIEEIQREVAERIRRYEAEYPELAQLPESDEVVRQPVYTYHIHAVN